MLPIVCEYLEQCIQRREEPYYGFVEHAGSNEVVADIDFAPLAAIRLFAVTLLRSRPRKEGLRLHALVLRYGVNKGEHHPPQRSKRLLPYEALAIRRRTEDDITDPAHRQLLRSFLDGVRMACVAAVRHLARLELCGLPLGCGNAMVEVTDKLFVRLTTATIASAFPSLKEAHFSECGLTDESARGLHSLIALSRSREQRAMWLSSFRKGSGGSQAADDSGARALEALDLSGNRFGDPTLKRLAIAITHDVSLRVVDMSRNAVTTAGLLEFLQQGTLGESGIESLDLSKNLITTDASYGAAEGFVCLCSCPQQLLLTRAPGAPKPRSVGCVVPRAAVALRREPSSPTVDQPAACTSPVPRSRRSSCCRSISAGTAVTETKRNTGIISQLKTTRRESANSPLVVGGDDSVIGRSSFSSAPPYRGRSPAVDNVYNRNSPVRVSVGSTKPSSHRRRPVVASSAARPSPTNDQSQCQILPEAVPLHPPPHFQPLLFSSPGCHQQQWCGVPLYVTLPFTPSAGVSLFQPAATRRDVAVGTSQIPSPSPGGGDDGVSASKSLSTAVGSVTGGSVLAEPMADPLRNNSWEWEEWKAREERFLEALVVRLENHETTTAELVERNYQLALEGLKSLKDELSLRIREVLEEQRADQKRLDMQQTAQRELQDPEEMLTNQLVQLIHTGMRSVHDQMAKASGASAAKHGADVGALEGRCGQSTQDYLREVKGFLYGLGW